MTKGQGGRIVTWQGEGPFPEIPNVNYASYLLSNLPEHSGSSKALVDAITGNFYTYEDLLRIIPAMRNGLAASGVRPGDKVMLITYNHIDMVPVAFAIMLLGAVCVPVNPGMTKEELRHIFGISEAKWVISHEKVVQKVDDFFKEALSPNALRKLWVIGEKTSTRPHVSDLMTSSAPEPKYTEGAFDAAETVALMPLSSGTTGMPKGVMLSHRNLVSTRVQDKFMADQTPSIGLNLFESSLIFLPMYHLMGFNLTIITLFTGGRAVILPRFSPELFFRAIEEHQVTFAPVVPYVLRFLENTSHVETRDLSSLLMFGTASEYVSASTLENVTKKSGRIIVQGYGLTETSGAGSGVTPDLTDRPRCIGKFGPFFQAKVIDLQTGEILGDGQEGELCLKGPAIMVGYANNAEATAETIDPEGWLHTGDVVYFDEEDVFYITGRIKDLIKVKGYQVAPAELETIIKEMNGVEEVAVAGIPDKRFGEVPRAWIVPVKGATIDKEAIMKNVAARVMPYKVLAGGVEIVDSIPKNHIGKVMRRHLRQSYEAARSKL
ncbi:uncharacterized protein LOC135201762 [Macrobrachium nipponense]|uniref:uncharacterized protein LOC135201762 n=1 Tax=Macrobrachium nipponense TaxID=159736 RepID=UPI0030C89B9F